MKGKGGLLTRWEGGIDGTESVVRLQLGGGPVRETFGNFAIEIGRVVVEIDASVLPTPCPLVVSEFRTVTVGATDLSARV